MITTEKTKFCYRRFSENGKIRGYGGVERRGSRVESQKKLPRGYVRQNVGKGREPESEIRGIAILPRSGEPSHE